jgi:hypothetical protein
VIVMLLAAFAATGAAAQTQEIQLSVTVSDTCVCVGSEVTLTLTASDYDFCHHISSCWDDLTFSGWPGDTPVKDGAGTYRSTWTHTYTEPGKYTYEITADDDSSSCCPPEIGDDAPAVAVVVIYVAGGLAIESPVSDMRFIVGPGECDIAIIATMQPSDCPCCTMKWYVWNDGVWQEKWPLLARGEDGKWRVTWDTDGTQRGDRQIKVELRVDDTECESETVTVFCARPTWPICADGQENGVVTKWLHTGGGPQEAVDIAITGTWCDGTAPLLASEDGEATRDQFTPLKDPCETVYCYWVNADYGDFNVELLDAQTPTYLSRSLENRHWHMANAGRVQEGRVTYHQSLGDGDHSGNCSNGQPHDHMITYVNGTGVSPDRTGATGVGTHTGCDRQLHPDWWP